jgi:uncharacterized protein YdcH (DUF465 family)
MTAAERAHFLEKKHKLLHDRIEVAEAEKCPDKYLTEMKKEKLALKDEISRLWNQVEQTKRLSS